MIKTIWTGCVIGLVTALAFVGCAPSPSLPDDQPTLARLADSDDLETALRATQKISEVYGEKALLDLIEKGGPNARGWAASLLLGHPSDRTKQALLVALKDSSPDVRSCAIELAYRRSRLWQTIPIQKCEKYNFAPYKQSSLANLAHSNG